MEVTFNGYVTEGDQYKKYFEEIMSMTPKEAFIASIQLGFEIPLDANYHTDWKKFYQSGDGSKFKGDWRVQLYETCKQIYKGSYYEFKDFNLDHFYHQNEVTAKEMKDAGGPSLGIVHSEGHVGGILLTESGNVVTFNTYDDSPRVQKIVNSLSNGTMPMIFNIKDLQTNKHSDNDGCQTLLFMFAAPFLANTENTMEKIRALERAMNYNEYMLDGLALFAKAVVGVRYNPPPVKGYDRRVLSDVVTKVYPSLLRSQLS